MNNTTIARLHAEVSADTTRASRNLRDFKGDLGGAAREATSTSGKLGGLVKAAGAIGLAFGAAEILGYAQQLYALGDASLKAEKGLTAVAGSAQAAADITAAVKRGSAGLLTEMDAQLAATRLLSLGMAENAEEAGRFTEVAATLGAVIGQDATTSVEQLSLAIANMSYERLDALGISAGQVRARVAELKEEGYATEEAFRLATLEIATGKLDELERAGFEAGTSLERLTIKAKDAGAALGEELATGVLAVTDAIENDWESIEQLTRVIVPLYGIVATVGEAHVAAAADINTATEAMRLNTEASNLMTVALSGVQAQVDALPLGEVEVETRLVAEAFFEAGYEAGYTRDQLRTLWEVAGGTADELGFLYENSTTIPPAMARIEGSSYGAARGMATAAAATRDFKDAIDELNNRRTGNYGRTGAVTPNLPMDARSFQERRAGEEFGADIGLAGGTPDYFQTTPASVIARANRLNAQYSYLNNVDWTPEGWVPRGSGGRSGGRGGARSAGRSAGAAGAREFAEGVEEGAADELGTLDAAGIKAAVIDWITDQQTINDIRDDLKTELADTMGATGKTVDMALEDLFGLRASPIDTLIDSMSAAAEQNAQQLEDVGQQVGQHIERGLETTFSGIGDKIVTRVLNELAEAA